LAQPVLVPQAVEVVVELKVDLEQQELEHPLDLLGPA
jgi:hypothetical protein